MGALLGAVVALCIGLSEVHGRRIVAAVGPMSAAWVLQIFGVVVAVVSALFIAGSPLVLDLMWGTLSGLGMAAGIGLYFSALTRSSSTVVAPVVATLSAVIPYAYALLRGADASQIAIVGAMVAFIGLAVVASGTSEVRHLRAGLSWGVLSGLGYGFGISVFVEASDESGAWPAVTQRGAAAVVLTVAALVVKAPLVPPRRLARNAMWAGVLAGITSVALVVGLRIDAASAIVTSSMFPVASVVLGAIYFADPVARRQVVGIALALAGIALVVSA